MNLIAAADISWGIGLKGNLLYNIPSDKSFFKSKTIGKTVIMGRLTYESLPCGSLPGRKNIILTHNSLFTGDENALICHSEQEVLKLVSSVPQEDIFIIGGQQVYDTFIKYCTHAFITKIMDTSQADRFLTNLDSAPDWTCISTSPIMKYNNISFTFTEYKRI